MVPMAVAGIFKVRILELLHGMFRSAANGGDAVHRSGSLSSRHGPYAGPAFWFLVPAQRLYCSSALLPCVPIFYARNSFAFSWVLILRASTSLTRPTPTIVRYILNVFIYAGSNNDYIVGLGVRGRDYPGEHCGRGNNIYWCVFSHPVRLLDRGRCGKENLTRFSRDWAIHVS